MKTPEQSIEILQDMVLKMNAALPTDIYLKGNGEIWITHHSNRGSRAHKATKEEIITYLWTAIDYGNRMISV